MGPELLPLLAIGGGTALQMSAAHKERKDKRQILNRQLERDDQATTKAIDQVQQEGQRFNQDARLQGLQEQEQKVFDQTSADVQGAGGSQISTAADAGNVSEDFIKGKAERAISEGTRLTSIAREAAKSRAPGMLQSEDALNRAKLAGNLQNTFGTNRNMGRAAGMDADSVQQPAYGALGSVASAIGAGMAANSTGSGINWDPDGSYTRKYAAGRGM